MTKSFLAALLLAATPAFVSAAQAAPTIGQLAPAFTAIDANGKRHALGDFKGKTVVLEWNNAGCPFVQKHYDSGNMQRLQSAAVADGVVWLTVNSGAAGKQGHVTGREANAQLTKWNAKPSAYILDGDGRIGRAYGATTTPHMYVIDPAGRLAYAGAIDDTPTADQADIATAKNHVVAALADVQAGRPVATATSKPYGCSVKY